MKNNSNLIFLISQPRSGSTLNQRILGCHGEIHTTSEPWSMLHPLYALKGLMDFLSLMENGLTHYLENMRTLYGNLYSDLLRLSGKKYFLDKTPRYYFIIEELRAERLQTEIIPLRSFARRLSWLYRIFLKLRRKSH